MNFTKLPTLDPIAIANLKHISVGQPSGRTKSGQKTYTITKEWLEEHDKQVRRDFLRRKETEIKTYAHKVIEDDFNERQKILEGDEGDIVLKLFSLVVAAPTRVLVRDFGWTPLGEANRMAKNMKLVRFANAVQEEIEHILGNELMDIRKYAKQVYDETGLMFTSETEE